ncbi:glycosyltransferase family 4 protein [Apilactobacillus kunkeei]|nr:glycosyltransferase family 4 protein [Apilactobacillus kunkeei]
MRIMYVNTLGVWGGVATYLMPIIKEQVNLGNEVYLVVGNQGELTNNVQKNIPEVKIIFLDTMQREIKPLSILKSIFKFRKLVKDLKPNIIHLNCIMAGLIGRIGSLFLKSKIVYNAHGWAFEPGTSKKYKWPAIIIEKILSYCTDAIICVSNYEKKIADKYSIFKKDNQAIVIKNASRDFGLSHNKIRPKDGSFTVTMSARFWEQKNQLLLIKGFEKFINRYREKNQFKLYLLGDGPKLNECKEYVKNHNMEKFIEFTGMVNNVDEYYFKSDVVALITNYDAIAISLIEGLSMSKPLIATNTCGVPENFYEDFSNGCCINNTVSDIDIALNYLFSNPEIRRQMGELSRKLYERDFKIEKNISLHNNLYENLLKK